MKFAKLYGPDEDQVLVTVEEGDKGPEMSVHFVADGLGVSHFKLRYPDWDLCDKAFDLMDEAQARKIITGILRDAGLSVSEDGV